MPSVGKSWRSNRIGTNNQEVSKVLVPPQHPQFFKIIVSENQCLEVHQVWEVWNRTKEEILTIIKYNSKNFKQTNREDNLKARVSILRRIHRISIKIITDSNIIVLRVKLEDRLINLLETLDWQIMQIMVDKMDNHNIFQRWNIKMLDWTV